MPNTHASYNSKTWTASPFTEEFKGKVVFLFFGYTQCPDVCPTTMADLAAVRKSSAPDGERVQGVFVTVDPERDKPRCAQTHLAGMDHRSWACMAPLLKSTPRPKSSRSSTKR